VHTAQISQLDDVGTRRLRYAEDGYCILKDYFAHQQIARVYDDIMAVFARQLRRLGIAESDRRDAEGLRQNLTALLNADRDAYLGAARQTQLLPSIHHLTTSPAIVATLEALGLAAPVVSTKPVCHFMTEALKIPGGYLRVPPHQDWRSMQGSLDAVVLWISLVDIDADSYPVECLPGSHKWGLLNTVPHQATPMADDARVRDEDFVALYPKRGDLVVFSGFLVHRTAERGDERVRLSMSLRYNNAAEPHYVAHGYPTPYKYDYQLELLFEDFPAEQDVRQIFTPPWS